MTTLGGFAASFMFLALTRFGVAFGEAGAVPSGHALIVRKIAPERRGLAIGLFAMGIPLGTMVGFAAGGTMADVFGWRIVLIGAGAIGILVGLLTILVAGPTPLLQQQPRATNPFCAQALKCYRPRHSAGCSRLPFSWASQAPLSMLFRYRF